MSDLTRAEAIAELTEHLNHWKRLLKEGICGKEQGERTIKSLELAIDSLKTDEAYNLMYEKVDFIEIPEGATNGQMFCRLFQPYGLKENGSCVWVWFTESDGTHYTLPKDWCNSPYRKEQE